MDQITLEDDSPQEIRNGDTTVDTAVDADYQMALQQLGFIVNSADTAFKRDYVGVIWKNLTVSFCLLMRADCRSK